TQVAKILNDIFVQRSGSTTDTPGKQIAPGIDSAQSRLNSLGSGSGDGKVTTASANAGNRGAGNPIAASFESFSDRKGTESDAPEEASLQSGGNALRGAFQNVRITADAANNSIVVYSNQEDYRVVERALRDLDRPKLQVAIDATVAEVTLTDDLQYGVQFFLKGNNVSGALLGGGAGQATAQSNVSAVAAASATAQSLAQSVLLQSVAPGLNLLVGSAAAPRVILNALTNLTDVKVLSSPSLVALDNQPALL